MADTRITNIFEHVDAAKSAKAKLYRDEAERKAKEREEAEKKEGMSAANEFPFLRDMEELELSQLFAPDDTQEAELQATGIDEREAEPVQEPKETSDLGKGTSSPEKRNSSFFQREKAAWKQKMVERNAKAGTENRTTSHNSTEVKPAKEVKMGMAVADQHTCRVYLMHRFDEANSKGAYVFAVVTGDGKETYHESQCGSSVDPCEFLLRGGIGFLSKVIEKDVWSAIVYTQDKETAIMLDRMARKLYPGSAITIRRKYVNVAQEAARLCELVFMPMSQDTQAAQSISEILDAALKFIRT